MESQPPNPEFRIDPKNFHPCSVNYLPNYPVKANTAGNSISLGYHLALDNQLIVLLLPVIELLLPASSQMH